MSEHTLSITLSDETKQTLEALAEKNGLNLAEALEAAVEEYIETWEDYHRTVAAIESGEDERRSLSVANE